VVHEMLDGDGSGVHLGVVVQLVHGIGVKHLPELEDPGLHGCAASTPSMAETVRDDGTLSLAEYVGIDGEKAGDHLDSGQPKSSSG